MNFRKLLKPVVTVLCAGALLLPMGCGSEEDDGVTVGYIERSEIENTTLMEWRENSENGDVNNSFPEDYEEVAYQSLNEVLLAMDSGDVDFIATSSNTAQYICDANEDYQPVDADKKFFYKMAMLEDNEELRDGINEAIAEIKSSVELYDLIDTYIANYDTAPSTEVELNNDYVTYRVGVSGNVPPLDYIDADGTPSGFNVAILNLIGEKIGVNFEYVSLDASARTTALVSGNIDLIFCENITDDSDMDEFEFEDTKLILTDYYYSDTNVFVTKDYPVEKIQEIYGLEDTTISSQEDLAGKKIGVVDGTYDGELAREKFTDSEIIAVESDYDLNISLNNGTVDAIVAPDEYLLQLDGVTVLDECLESVDSGIALNKDCNDLQEEMTALVEQYEADGTLKELQEKWLEADDLSDVEVGVDTDYSGKNGTLTVIVDSAYFPYAYYNGGCKGYCYELVLMMCKELGYQLEFIPCEGFQASFDAVTAGDADMFISSLAITPSREESLLFVKNGLKEEYYVGVLK